jgi:hypothetical protein
VLPELTLVFYLVAAASAIGYACLGGLTVARRIAVSALALLIELDAGFLLATHHLRVAQSVGIPGVLAIGAIMVSPRRAAHAPARVPDRARRDTRSATSAIVPRQLDRRRRANGSSVPILTDPWAALYSSLSGRVEYESVPTAPLPGPRTSRRSRGGRPMPRHLRLITRCRSR